MSDSENEGTKIVGDADDPLRAQSNDLSESTWESLPSDSESQVDYHPEVSVIPPITPLRVMNTSLEDVLSGLPPELAVTMSINFPDGTLWEYRESCVIEDDSAIDEAAQALALAEIVGAVMVERARRNQS